MTSKNRPHLLTLLLVLLLLPGCQKEWFNYRNKYLGKWDFQVYRSSFNMANPGENWSDSVHFTGEISYGTADNLIRIQYTSEQSIELVIDEDGTLSAFPSPYCSGSFSGKDSLNLYLRWGGLGGGTTHVVAGTRQ